MLKKKRNNQKISFLIPSFGGGGAERVMSNLANAMYVKGYEVDMLLFADKGPVKKSVLKGVSCIEIGKFGPKALYNLLVYLKKERPNCLVSSLCHCNFLSIIAARLTGIPSIIREANYPPAIFKYSNSYVDKMAYRLYFFCYKYADLVLSPSNKIALVLEKRFKVKKYKLKVFNNPSISDEFDQLVNEAPCHPWFGDVSSKIILGVGRLEPAKGFSQLIKAVSLLSKEQNLKLIILGDGNERKNLLALIDALELQDSVSLPGFIENPYSFMRMADVFVLSSFYEGMPNVLIQAMASGTTIVSTNCLTGPDELLEGGRLGRLVPVGDLTMMASEINQALEHPTDCDILKNKVKKYRVSNVSSAFESLIKGYLSR